MNEVWSRALSWSLHKHLSTGRARVVHRSPLCDALPSAKMGGMSQQHSFENVPEWDLYDRLQKALRVRDITPTGLAKELGVHRNTINNYLSGRSPIDRRTILAWAMACGVSATWLEHGTTAAPPSGGGNDGFSSGDTRTGVQSTFARHLQIAAA